MSMGPLPTLNPPTPVDIGKLAQTSLMLQAGPLELQQRRQALQAGQLAIQEQQQNLAQRQALNKAYRDAVQPDASGKPQFDTDKLTNALAASGVAGEAIPGVLKGITDYQKLHNDVIEGQQKIELGSRDAGGAAGYAIQKANYDPNLADSIIQHQLLTPNIDPQHAQMYNSMRQQIQQNPQSVKQIADQLIAQSPKYTELQSQELTAAARQLQAKTGQERLTAELPGGPLENVDRTALQNWLKKNPGKDASDYVAWKAKQSPSMILAGNMLKGDALDQNAENYFQTGKLPQGLSRSPGTTAAIINRASQLHPGESLAASSEAFRANQQSLNSLQKNFDQVSAFENTAIRNLDLFQQKMKAVPDLGTRFANIPLRKITAGMIGDANMAALNAARQTAAAEAAKVLSSANASGVLSDSQKREAEDVLDGNATYAATVATINTLKQDFANRHQSYAQQIDDIKRRTSSGTQQSQPSAPLEITLPSGKKVSIK